MGQGVGIGVRVYDFIHGKDHPFQPGSTEPKESAVKEQARKDSIEELKRKAMEAAGGGAKRAQQIDEEEQKALKTNYAKGGPVRKPGYATGGSVPPMPMPMAPGGGPVMGPGTGTSDSVPINASNGEYVIPAEVVHVLGTKFFDELIAQVQGAAPTEPGVPAAASAPNPYAELAGPVPGEG